MTAVASFLKLRCRVMHLDGWQLVDSEITWEELMEDERILEIGYFIR